MAAFITRAQGPGECRRTLALGALIALAGLIILSPVISTLFPGMRASA